MTNLITGLVGIAIVLAFLGIMLLWVPALPLILIVLVVMALLLVDFVGSLRSRGENSR